MWTRPIRINAHLMRIIFVMWTGLYPCNLSRGTYRTTVLINNFNGQSTCQSPYAVRVVYSDASNSGYESYLVEHGCHIAHGQWLPQERIQSSTWRELNAVHKVLASLTNKLPVTKVYGTGQFKLYTCVWVHACTHTFYACKGL